MPSLLRPDNSANPRALDCARSLSSQNLLIPELHESRISMAWIQSVAAGREERFSEQGAGHLMGWSAAETLEV